MRIVILFFLFISFPSWSQKANFIKLEKLYSPEVSDGNYSAWKQESLLIPVRFESSRRFPVDIQVTVPGLEPKIEWFELHSVLADFAEGFCGQAKVEGTFEKALIPDRARPTSISRLEADSTVKWGILKLTIPRQANAGSYDVLIRFSQNGKKTNLRGSLDVLDRVATKLEDVPFGVDFWQFPINLADYYKVKPWSEKHWNRIDEMFISLRDINQMSLTISIFWDLYNNQLRPLDEMMIQVIRQDDGQYRYDFSNLESYILRAEEMGLAKQISIHNLYPWNQKFFYFDETSQEVISVNALPNSEKYQEFFEPLICATSDFLESKNWKSKTYWVIDERSTKETMALKNWVDQISPGFQFSYAGSIDLTLASQMEEYALPMNIKLEDIEFEARVKTNGKTLLYTSCYEKANQPNSLITSDLRDIYFLVHLAHLKGYQGILHWAYNLWSSQIITSAIFSDVPSGDTHFVYPDGDLSVRYLVFQDAIEEIGKFQLISRIQNPKEMKQSFGRYFLINIEPDRFQAVEAMKNYIND